MGDSKITATYNWFTSALGTLTTNTPSHPTVETPARFAVGGKTVKYWRDNIDTRIAAETARPDKCVIILGANDLSAGADNYTQDGADPTSAVWKANFAYILDALHTWNPSMEIWLGLVWRQGYDSACNTIDDTLIPAVMSGRAYCHLGMDERVYIKAGDNGATNTVDGVHPNAAGNVVYAAQYVTLLT